MSSVYGIACYHLSNQSIQPIFCETFLPLYCQQLVEIELDKEDPNDDVQSTEAADAMNLDENQDENPDPSLQHFYLSASMSSCCDDSSPQMFDSFTQLDSIASTLQQSFQVDNFSPMSRPNSGSVITGLVSVATPMSQDTTIADSNSGYLSPLLKDLLKGGLPRPLGNYPLSPGEKCSVPFEPPLRGIMKEVHERATFLIESNSKEYDPVLGGDQICGYFDILLRISNMKLVPAKVVWVMIGSLYYALIGSFDLDPYSARLQLRIIDEKLNRIFKLKENPTDMLYCSHKVHWILIHVLRCGNLHIPNPKVLSLMDNKIDSSKSFLK